MAFDNVPNKPAETAEIKPKHEPEVLKTKPIEVLKTKLIIDIDLSHIPLHLQPEKTTAQILREAADLIEERGWGNGNLSQMKEDGTEGYFCILGAISKSSLDYSKFNVIACYLGNLLMPKLRAARYLYGGPLHGHNAVALYNDNIAGSRQEVIDFLRYAAKHAEVICS